MTKLVDLAGLRFGKLTVGPNHVRRGRQTFWPCICDCGNGQIEVWAASLRAGKTRSCGCLHKEAAVRWTKHGQEGSKLYKTWQGVKRRCLNPNSNDFSRYGGRGIRIHDAWRDDFLAFSAGVGDPPSKRHSIDRIDNDGDYAPGNVRWSLPRDQANNTSATKRLEFDGECLTITGWAERTGLSRAVIFGRLRLGWSVERVLNEPKRGTGDQG